VRDNPKVLRHDPKRIGTAICARYPFMRRPADAAAAPAGLNELTHIAPPPKLLTHRLMGIEAQALTGAMGYLEGGGVLALPMHDGLIVPASGAQYAPGGLVGAYLLLGGQSSPY
jgi:hypothetical protein